MDPGPSFPAAHMRVTAPMHCTSRQGLRLPVLKWEAVSGTLVEKSVTGYDRCLAVALTENSAGAAVTGAPFAFGGALTVSASAGLVHRSPARPVSSPSRNSCLRLGAHGLCPISPLARWRLLHVLKDCLCMTVPARPLFLALPARAIGIDFYW